MLDLAGDVFDSVLMSARRERTVTPAEIDAAGGLPVAELQTLMEAFGLLRPAPDQPTFTPGEAQALIELGQLDELWPADVRLQVGRAYGALVSAIARAEVQAFQLYTEPLVRRRGGDDAAQLRAIQSAFARLQPLAEPLLAAVHSRWIEHELAERVVRAAERRLGADSLPGAVEMTFAFCDLKDFTAFAEAQGDAAAIAAIDRFFTVIGRERGSRGELVKSLGDGAMLAYEDPASAVDAASRVIAAMRAPDLPAVHASVHRGTAIARSGDYFGGTVNLAARLLARAGAGELLATGAVVDACGGAFDWKPAGEHTLRGVAAPVPVYALALPLAG